MKQSLQSKYTYGSWADIFGNSIARNNIPDIHLTRWYLGDMN